MKTKSFDLKKYLIPLVCFIISIVVVVVYITDLNAAYDDYNRVHGEYERLKNEYQSASLEYAYENITIDNQAVEDDVEHIKNLFNNYLTWDSYDEYMSKRDAFINVYGFETNSNFVNDLFPKMSEQEFSNLETGEFYRSSVSDFRYAIARDETVFTGYTYMVRLETFDENRFNGESGIHDYLLFVSTDVNTGDLIFGSCYVC